MLQETLFSSSNREELFKSAPLAFRMRPKSFQEYVGQDHIVGENKLLRRLIEVDRIESCIFFGPPGTGKTSLAYMIASLTESDFVQLNAVESKVSDVRTVISDAKKKFDYSRVKTILFIDEIHRFNKSQQDSLLRAVEDGTIRLIGATTVNPIYGLNSALVSRSRLFEFKPLLIPQISKALQKSLESEKGLQRFKVKIEKKELDQLAKKCEGDLRQAYNNLELAVVSTLPDDKGLITVTKEIIEEVTSHKILPFDDNDHYDLISAFIKSMRASKEDDALHYLSRMIISGEDPLFIARRMIIFASEDVGMADSNALVIATDVFRACETIGLPEARINLSHGVVYLSRAPKDRTAYEKINAAIKRVTELPNNPVPKHLRNWNI